jgi:hypothetical protein
MGVEIGRGRDQMRTLAEPGQRRCKHTMAARAQALGDRASLPAAAPGPVHQNEIGHGGLVMAAWS